MKIININELKPTDNSKGPLFFGGSVTTQHILEEDHKGSKIRGIMVNFEPGARNKLHMHTSGQILIITQGKGIVATKDKEYIVTSGMIAYFPAGEEHWHGATKDSDFSRLSILGDPYKFKNPKDEDKQ